MAAGVRSLLVLHRTFLGFAAVQRPALSFSRQLCDGNENKLLLENLNLMGVDVKMARQRQPAVLHRDDTNERALATFLESKGANSEVIASVITRYPRSITRSVDYVERRWMLWRKILASDKDILHILGRSPESFFRSHVNNNFEENIDFLSSLGLGPKYLKRILNSAPRTYLNRVELNKEKVEFLKDICTELGGDNPEQFAAAVISRNAYILTISTEKMRTNIDNLKNCLNLKDHELFELLQSPAAELLDLANGYLKDNITGLEEKMLFLGATRSDAKKMILKFPLILYPQADKVGSRLDCLVENGITLQQIVQAPRVFEIGTQTIMRKMECLKKVDYDFEKNGIGILEWSRKRFDEKMKKLSSLKVP